MVTPAQLSPAAIAALVNLCAGGSFPNGPGGRLSRWFAANATTNVPWRSYDHLKTCLSSCSLQPCDLGLTV